MGKFTNKTREHEMIELFCSADDRTIIEHELEVNLADTGITVEFAQDFMLYV